MPADSNQSPGQTDFPKRRTVLSSWATVIDYCRTAMALADNEQFRLLVLDKRHQPIADEPQQVGTVGHSPVYPRES